MIETYVFGEVDGAVVQGYRLVNANGLSLNLISYGARITELLIPDREGRFDDIVLGFGDLQSYVQSGVYHGAVCGRFGNRIAGGRFELDGAEWRLSRNDGCNHLHGGFSGFDRKNWQSHTLADENAVCFTLRSPHLDEGFPGNLDVEATYRLGDDDALTLEFRAISDRDTVVSLINHSHWNLAGQGAQNIDDHWLAINAGFYLPVDAEVIPTGEIRSVAGTRYDFSERRRLAPLLARAGENPYQGNAMNSRGYDNTWVLDNPSGFGPAAQLSHPPSGRSFELFTSEPSVQCYTTSYLDEEIPGKSGSAYKRFSGIALETQMMPNSPNVAHFSNAVLKSGDVYSSRHEYRFGIVGQESV